MAETLLPQVFRKDPPYIASYDYADVISGNSYLKLYCSAAFPKATIYESLTSEDDSNATLTSIAVLFCQTFTVGTTGTNEDFWINGVEIYGNGFTDLKVYIKAVDVNGKPAGDILAYGQTVIGMSTANSWCRFNFAYFAKLVASTKYALVLERVGINNIIWRYDGSSPSYTNGSYGTSADSGATWTMDNAKDFLFKILGDTRPPLTFFREDLQNADSYSIININSTSYTQKLSCDIDVIFGRSSSIQGNVQVSIPITLDINAQTYISAYYTANLICVRAGVEISVGTAVTKTLNVEADTTTTLLAQIYVENQFVFLKTDTLKLRLACFYKTINTGNSGLTLDFKNIWIKLPYKVQ